MYTSHQVHMLLTSDRLEQPRRLLGRVWNTFFTDSRLTHSGAVSMYISFSIDTGTGIRYDELSTHHQNRPEIDYVRLWTISWPLKSSKWFFLPFLCQFTSLPGTSGENMTFCTLKDGLYCRIALSQAPPEGLTELRLEMVSWVELCWQYYGLLFAKKGNM